MFFLIILLEVPGESHPQTGLAKLKSGIDLIRLVIEVVLLSGCESNIGEGHGRKFTCTMP